MKVYGLLVTGFILASIGAHAQAVTSLVCQGSGSVQESKVSNGTEYDEKTHSYTKSTHTSTTDHRSFNGAVNVELAGNTVRMKLPHELVPALNNSQEGWFTLTEVFVGDKEITGILGLNFLNKPKVRIDRVTGQLAIASGFEEFNGNCSKFDPDAAPKF